MSTTRTDVDDVDRLARVTLSRTIEPGDLRVTGLVSELGAGKVLDYLEAAGDVESHWGFALAQELGRVDPAQVLEQAAARGIRFIVPGDAEWPTQLGALRNAGALHERGGEPVGLWVRGAHDLRQLAGNSVAVVGSRAATSYGADQATELSRDLATMGHTVISGLAYGVDQAAHRGALIAGGPTIAVLAGGVDRPYPAAHAQLLEAIAERGLVVSEAPSGAGPTRTRFLARSRVVAGATHPLSSRESAELAAVLVGTDDHPWPAELSTRQLGRFSREPVAITRVTPTVIVEVEADTAFDTAGGGT